MKVLVTGASGFGGRPIMHSIGVSQKNICECEAWT
jgi:hypothetical protein